MAADVRVRHGHKGRGALRAGTAVTEEPRARTELLVVAHNLDRSLACLRLTAKTPESGPQ